MAVVVNQTQMHKCRLFDSRKNTDNHFEILFSKAGAICRKNELYVIMQGTQKQQVDPIG